MPMLATVIASTTAKPSMTLPRNRNVGSFADIDRGHARFDNPTSNPRLVPKNQQNRERELPDLVLKMLETPHARACPGHLRLDAWPIRKRRGWPGPGCAKASPGFAVLVRRSFSEGGQVRP